VATNNTKSRTLEKHKDAPPAPHLPPSESSGIQYWSCELMWGEPSIAAIVVRRFQNIEAGEML